MVGFRGVRITGAAKEDHRGTGNHHQRLVGTPMKARISRIMIALASVAMIAIAGGASVRGF